MKGIGLGLMSVVVVGALAGCQSKYESGARVTAASQNAESAATRAEAAAHRVEQAAGRAEAAAQRAEAVVQKLEESHSRRR
jgi:hypothetical protein